MGKKFEMMGRMRPSFLKMGVQQNSGKFQGFRDIARGEGGVNDGGDEWGDCYEAH